MKGKNHIRVGACTLGVGAVLGVLPAQEPRVALIAAGLFLFGKVAPDLDHAGSSITKSWGWISQFYAWALVRPFARLVYNTTKTARDRQQAPTHRYFTHTGPGALLAGWLLLLIIESGVWVASIAVGLMVGGMARVYDRDWKMPVALVAGGLCAWSWPLIESAPWPLAIALTVGCFAHSLDDCTTKFGTPLAFPFRDRETGQRWKRRGTPEWMRYETGTPAETAVMGACVIATFALAWWVWIDPMIRQVGSVG